MHFTLTSEQQALKDSVARYIDRDYGFEARWSVLRSSTGWSPEHWQHFVELGLTALLVSEEAGGMAPAEGFGVELMLVMEEFGRGLVLEPYLGCAVMPAAALSVLPERELTRPWLRAIAEEGRRIALAFTEPGQRYERAALHTRAEPDGQGGHRLHGAKIVVLGGDTAEALLVTARTPGEQEDGLFWVETQASGLTCLPYPMQDGQRGADFRFEAVPARRVAGPGHAGQALEYALDVAGAALCAEAVGAMAELLRITVEYLKTRRQFGRPIGANQALQHRAVDMLMQVEMARSMAIEAALAVSKPQAERARAISAARVVVADACRFVGQQAVQLHGGIGVTHELNVSHYFKRLTMIAATFGDADWHLARYGEGLLAA